MSKEKGLVYIMDMESSLSDALVRRIIDMDQYCVYRKWDMPIDTEAEVTAFAPTLKAIILSGSAKNVNSTRYTPPNIPPEFLKLGVPILAICYGLQHLCKLRGVNIVRCWDEQDPNKRTKAVRKKDQGEQGSTMMALTGAGHESILFRGLGNAFPVWMKHSWMAETLPEGWTLTASTQKCPIAAMEMGNIFAVQFHPEPYNSLFGRVILHNFLSYACGVSTPYF
jgi:GMP synthase (glutamine-hydrolysing)